MVKNTNDNLFLSILTLEVCSHTVWGRDKCHGVCGDQKTLSRYCFCHSALLNTGLYATLLSHARFALLSLAFLWVLGVCTQVASLCNQHLYPLSYLPIPQLSLMNKDYFNKCENIIFECFYINY